MKKRQPVKIVKTPKKPVARRLEGDFKLIEPAPGAAFPSYQQQKRALDILLDSIGKSISLLESVAAKRSKEDLLTMFAVMAANINGFIILSEGLAASLNAIAAGNLAIGATAGAANQLLISAQQMASLFTSVYADRPQQKPLEPQAKESGAKPAPTEQPPPEASGKPATKPA